MSRLIRRRLLSMVDILEKANQLLEQRFGNVAVSEEDIVELLSKCQDSAVIMGGMIESAYGEGTNIVKELEKYCRTLYPLALALNNRIVRGEHLDQLKEYVRNVRICLDKEIPNKLEVVFLPYKASMWDSLESVYWAAEADLDCDAYVVPIPYYDRTHQQHLGDMHYEGNDFPQYVEITDWQDYRLEERNPDMIFIHNPYDDCNLVTSVLPRFYAKNLKNYTDCLVYIPYFVLPEIEPESQAEIEEMKHFCFLPGVIYADKVIVQSEKMRSIYISEYMKAARKLSIETNRRVLEEKILGLGSPKIDKVLRTRREDCAIPEDWQEKMRRPDGSWKKVVLYNTSITPLLKHQGKMLEKMKSVFAMFREKQSDAVLLWRPHPLIQTTIVSMHPELWKGYKEILDGFMEGNWGIYDDTSDVERAIAISDAYYGDPSSLVQMYQATRKPVIVQDALIREDDYFPEIPWATYAGGDLWGTCGNGLYRIDATTGDVNFMTSTAGSFVRVFEYKGKFILIPGDNEQIACYELDRGKLTYFDIKSGYEKQTLKFLAYAEYEEYLFLFPFCEKYILVINRETMQLDYIDEPIKEYEERYGKQTYLFSPTVCSENSTVFIPCYSENVIFIMNLETKDYFWEEIPLLRGKGIKAMTKKGNTFFLISQKNMIFSWDRVAQNIKLLIKNGHSYAGILYNQDILLLFPEDESPIIKYDLINKKSYIFEYDNEFKFSPYLKTTFNSNIIKSGEKIFVGMRCANELIQIDLLKGKIEFVKFHLKRDSANQYIEKNSIYERNMGGIGRDMLCLINGIEKKELKPDNSLCGKLVYESIRLI